MKPIYEMTLEERQAYIVNKGLSNTYNKLNDNMKNVLKELKGYEGV
jgi:hypothetical protein